MRDGEEIPEEILPHGLNRLYLRPRIAAAIERHFLRLYYYRSPRTIFQRRWLGVSALKYPTDLWIWSSSHGQPARVPVPCRLTPTGRV